MHECILVFLSSESHNFIKNKITIIYRYWGGRGNGVVVSAMETVSHTIHNLFHLLILIIKKRYSEKCSQKCSENFSEKVCKKDGKMNVLKFVPKICCVLTCDKGNHFRSLHELYFATVFL